MWAGFEKTERLGSDRSPLEYRPSPAISIFTSQVDDGWLVPDRLPYNADPLPCQVDLTRILDDCDTALSGEGLDLNASTSLSTLDSEFSCVYRPLGSTSTYGR